MASVVIPSPQISSPITVTAFAEFVVPKIAPKIIAKIENLFKTFVNLFDKAVFLTRLITLFDDIVASFILLILT